MEKKCCECNQLKFEDGVSYCKKLYNLWIKGDILSGDMYITKNSTCKLSTEEKTDENKNNI